MQIGDTVKITHTSIPAGEIIKIRQGGKLVIKIKTATGDTHLVVRPDQVEKV